jgi:uncharacterized Fe-S cluster protein YjdI
MTEPLTWACHVCGAVRPDDLIAVHKSRWLRADRIAVQTNVRYCADRPDCLAGAPAVAAGWMSPDAVPAP